MKLSQKQLSLVSGALIILFGFIALLFPGITIMGLAIYFAISVLIGGIALTISAIKQKDVNGFWVNYLLEGIIGILLGIIIIARPKVAASVFMVVAGLWALLIGVILIWNYVKNKRLGQGNHFSLLNGVISVMFGLLIILNPFEGTRAIVIIIGIFAIAYGISSIVNVTRKSKSK